MTVDSAPARNRQQEDTMSSTHREGDRVEWNWGTGTGQGRVSEVFTSDVTRTISGTDVKRNASEDEPAYLIEQDDGDEVLKSGSELRALP